jgi:hypothetical protein
MLLTIKESAALYVMDMILSNLPGIVEASNLAVGNVDACLTPLLEDDTRSGTKRNNEDIMMLLRY